MDEVVIYHNPRCSKSRAALALLQEHGVEPRIVPYLEQPPSAAEIEELLVKLGAEPRQILRRGEAVYAALGLGDAGKSRAELIAAMAANPILIERPIVVRGERAVVGRPAEAVVELVAG